MNTRECLIIIKDKIKTSEVKKYQYNHDTQKMDITFQNGSVYSYLCDNVQVLKNPDILNPAMYHISRAGKTFLIYLECMSFTEQWMIIGIYVLRMEVRGTIIKRI